MTEIRKIEKSIQCPKGDIFDIILEEVNARCPIDNELVISPFANPQKFIFHDLLSGILISSPKIYLITSPATLTRIYFGYKVLSDPGSTVEFFELPTVTSTDINKKQNTANLDRNIVTGSELVIIADPVITKDGTRITVIKQGSATSPKNIVDIEETNIDSLIVLKRNTQYIMKITPIADNTSVNVNMFWYEVK